jgi:hypothetical protein
MSENGTQTGQPSWSCVSEECVKSAIRLELVDIVIDCREFLFSNSRQTQQQVQKAKTVGYTVIEGETTTDKDKRKEKGCCHLSLWSSLSTLLPVPPCLNGPRKNNQQEKAKLKEAQPALSKWEWTQ